MGPRLLSELRREWPAEMWQDVPVVAAVSGGADSVAMAAGLVEMRASIGATEAPLVLAHLDHGLRDDSARDAELVAELAAQWGLRLVLEKAHGLTGDEASAREARYEFLRKAASDVGARYLAVAHTADDQVETVLHRILRGTGVRGLRGMPKWRRLTEMTTLVRPLLTCHRADVLAYLHALALPWNEDATNQSARYTRNRLRHELLPMLEADHPQVRDSLLRLADRASAVGDTLETLTAEVWDDAVTRWDAEPSALRCDLDTNVLRALGESAMVTLFQRVWSRLALPEQAMDGTAWKKLCQLAWRDDGIETLPGNVRVSRVSTWLVIQSVQE